MKLPKSLGILVLIIIAAIVLTSISIPQIQIDDLPQVSSDDNEAVVIEASISPESNHSDITVQPDTSFSSDPPTAPEESPEVEEPPVILPPFRPFATEGTQPDLMIASTGIMADGKTVDEFEFPDPICFGSGDDYTQFEGVSTFRGNNYRDSAAYGYASINNAAFGEQWKQVTSTLVAPDGAVWTGHGWSGQALTMKWPKQTRQLMQMHDWAKEQDELVEVIYAALDGNIYFNELETGRETRNKAFIGYTFKGSGAIDPRGYPLLYVGAGYNSTRGTSKIFVISLIDCSVLYSFAGGDGFAPRNWSAADSSPLIDAATDRLIYCSENGVIYFIKLNSSFDPETGTMTIDVNAQDVVKWRFVGKRSHSNGKYWLGMETSPVIFESYLYIADNGGHLICLDINTLDLIWVRDLLDDTNCSPVLELEDGHPYIFISTSYHSGWRASSGASATVPIWKIDAETGEIVWQSDYTCYTVSGVSGGVLGTAAVGKNSLAGIVYVPVSRSPSIGAGTLAALNKSSGEVVWELQTKTYGWSSPVCVYTENGTGYVIFCTADGNMFLIDGLTGEVLDTVNLGGTIEASPVVFENTVVIGTRAQRIFGIKLT